MTDTIAIVGFSKAIGIDGLFNEEVSGTIYLQRGIMYGGERCRKILACATYSSRKERKSIMLQWRLAYDTWNGAGFHFLIVPDDIEFEDL